LAVDEDVSRYLPCVNVLCVVASVVAACTSQVLLVNVCIDIVLSV
jgi:hypothetical protein